jgi:diguanylate cyclase (GGDEF)-like protein
MSNEDLLVFEDESEETSLDKEAKWNILIVDDDKNVHTATKYALKDASILHQKLNFFDAYSAAEAKELLTTQPDVAVILLDVVMETPNAGLDLVAFIRQELGLDDVRIVLRTGEPNQAPEMAVIRDYDINDYKLKSEVTQKNLYVCLTAALRCYEQLKTIKEGKEALNSVLSMGRTLLSCANETEFHDIVFENALKLANNPDGAMLVIEVDNDLEVSHAAGKYADNRGLMLVSSGDEAARQTIELCLSTKRNVMTGDGYAMYLGSETRGERCCFIGGDKQRNEVTEGMAAVFARNSIISGDNIFFVERLRTHAYTDALTRLPNRLAFEQAITELQANRPGNTQVLAIIDIDGFAELNVALGQNYGDLLLKVAADRLKNRFRAPCYLARIGSNGFALFGPDSHITTENLLMPFSDPFEIAGEPQLLGVTAVIALLSDAGLTGGDVIKDVSIALKQAKKHHRGHVVHFDRAVVDGARLRLQTLKKLREAFDLNELFLVFQPKLNLHSGRVVGLEALLRWRTKQGDFISPAEFIPLAEQSGLIIRLGEWVLRNAIAQLVAIRKRGFMDIHIAVNLSVAQLQHPDILNMLSRVMGEFSISPNLIELEITESIAMGDVVGNIAKLNRIKNMGFQLAMDDFGTGFSSLNYLQQMPIDCLKIDRAFVQTSNTKRGSEIVEMIIQLSKTLGLRVVAEGVEELAQATLLKSLNCDEVQGYYFARPMPSSELCTWLESQK